MKILRIVYDWPPPWMGLAANPYELSRAQVKLGHTIDVLSGRWPRQGPHPKDDGITNHYFLNNPLFPFRTPLQGLMLVTIGPFLLLMYLWYRRNNTPDLIHLNGHFGLWVSIYRALLKKIKPNSKELKIPLVAQFHNTVEGRKRKVINSGTKPKLLSKYIDWPLARLSDTLAVKHADALVFVGQENLEQAVVYYGADVKKCHLVETGVNTDLFQPVIGAEKNKVLIDMGLEPGDKIVMFSGFFVERKGLHHLIEAINKLPFYYKLLLVGDYPKNDTEYKNRITDLISINRVEHRVFFSGYVPYPQTHIAYQSADVFVLPSSFEGTPKVVLEALSCNVPAVVSGFKLTEEVSGLSYLENTDPKTIARAILEVTTNKPHVDRDKIHDKFSWDVKARQMEEIYQKVLSKRGIIPNENTQKN